MPPVALTAATARIAPTTQPAGENCTDDCASLSLPSRPALRLVGSAPAGGSAVEAEIVHGWGGPSSCGCRECTMARHPAAMPRLRVVD